MNISRLQNMIRDRDCSLQCIRYLLDCHCECEHLDYKIDLNLGPDHNNISLVKDILGMKNMGGGYLVIGVEDKSWKPVGINKPLNLDSKLLKDLVRKHSGLELELDFVTHSIDLDGERKTFGIVFVRGTTKASKLRTPSQSKIDSHSDQKWGIRRGDIYARYGDQTILVTDLDEFGEKIAELQDSYVESEMAEASKKSSPFAVESGLYRLLPKEYNTFVGRNEILNKLKGAIEGDPRIWIVNLYGPGGVGKSALATKLAYEYYDMKKFEAILHLSAKDRELSSDSGIKVLLPSLFSLEDLLDKLIHLFSYDDYCPSGSSIETKKSQVIELLNAFSTLLILDNMETINDGRIMEFIRSLPPTTKTKVLITSRSRSSEWELPIQVPELSRQEILEFIEIKTQEMKIDFPKNSTKLIDKISDISGGLPLAIQWILGAYAKSLDIDKIFTQVISNESPLLEFSFRNTWNLLEDDAKTALAVLPLFDEAPTLQEWRMILNWPIDKMERARSSLIESTFVSESINQKTGERNYIALPITLSFANLELAKLGSVEQNARSAYQKYKQRLDLSNTYEEDSLFEKFNATSALQQKAIILTRQGEAQLASFGYEEAEDCYKQALMCDPSSIYALVMYGKLKAAQYDFEAAIELNTKAIQFITRKTYFFVYYNLAMLHGENKDYGAKERYLREAMKFPELIPAYEYTLAQHSLGVTLGKLGRHSEAITHFDSIIDDELRKRLPSKSLVFAVRTKRISLLRMRIRDTTNFIDEIISRCEQLECVEEIISELRKIKTEDL